MVEMRTIQVGHEWAYIVTDEDTGLFVAHGSYGTFAHCWPPRGRSRTLHEFLIGLGFDYFMNKARHHDFMSFDCDATKRAMAEEIRSRRRSRDITKDEARDAWDDLDLLEDTNSLDAFTAWMSDTLRDALGENWYELLQRTPAPECREFWRVIWPAFLAEITPTAQEV